MTINQLREKFIKGELTPESVLADTKKLIKEKDADIHAFLGLFADAEKEAKAATLAYQNKEGIERPLLGVPVALKNNILVKGENISAGSKILQQYVATYDATIVKKLKEAGAVLVGSTNMDEFAMGSSTENSAFGPTKNPVDPTRVPGGSSGGSAAAVAMGAVPVAIGTDTGGSIRQPASYCGLVGFKPTYGAVSRFGLVAMGSSLDQAGPLTNSVSDAQLIHQVISGKDDHDMTTIDSNTYPEVAIKETYTFGVPRDFLKDGIDPDLMAVFEEHIEKLKQAGHQIIDIDLPLFEQGLAAYYIVMPAEVSSNLARFDGMRYGERVAGEDLLAEYLNTRALFGDEPKRRILLGTYVLSSGYYDAYYGKAEAVRSLMRSELNEVFKKADFVLTPTAPTPAFKFGAQKDLLSMYRQDIFTVPVNLTGVPALSFPMGVVKRDDIKLPVGVQYIAPHSGEDRLFDIGKRIYDQAN
jgi:aspartyl-tRNA(Asn)/glutamyl-tRNA(Gln) amidotransferase subunit A